MARQSSFWKRAVAGYAVIIVLTALMLGFAVRAIHALKADAEAITEDSAQDVAEAARLQDAAERESSHSRGYLMTRSDDHLLEIEGARAQFHASLDRLRTIVDAEESRQLVETIRWQERQHRDALDPLLDLRGAQADAESVGRLYEEQVLPKRQALDDSIDVLVANQNQRFLREVDAYADDARRTMLTIGGLAAACLLGILMVAAIFARLLTRQYEVERVARQTREEILALVSHDLKNPLGSIVMAAALLERGAGRDDAGASRHKHTATIRRAAGRMSALLGDLLDASSIESGRFKVEATPCAVGPLIAEALEAARPMAAVKSVRIDEELSAPGALVHGDYQRLLQVLGNLLGNAVKFTPEGGRIVVQSRPVASWVRFTVADSGPGIAPEQRAQIFERFRRGARSSGGGTGLGLYIVRGIVETHGGKVWVESGALGGTAVSFTIPRVEGQGGAARAS